LQTARQLSGELADRGITVVSGMAIGIDTAAHQGALDANGRTVAVLGSGLARVYPAVNRKLFERIVREGAVISEFAMLSAPEPHHFPMRNRVISGISIGTVVVEASRKSGSLITARLAAEQNREVFAVPGSIRSFKSTGAHTLIKQGAKLVENTSDILEEIGHRLHYPSTELPATETQQPACGNLTPDEQRVFDALSPYPLHIDDLTRCVGMQPGKVASILLQLELKGRVVQSTGKFFALFGG
jgi:DNA processing protein